jgi:hypothetical protein
VTSGPTTRYVLEVTSTSQPARTRAARAIRAICAGLPRVLVVAALAAWLAPACSLAEGSGSVLGTLNVNNCWSGAYNLQPNFFAAVPSASPALGSGANQNALQSDSLQLRIQNGGDFESFSDGLAILVDDAGQVLGQPTPDGNARPSLLGQNLVVSLPAGVEVTGVPVVAIGTPGIVHGALYLQKTCRTQDVALYALSAVTVNADGTCDRPDGGDPPLSCGAPATLPDTDAGAIEPAYPQAGADAGAGPTRTSWINFTSLFDGNPDEAEANKRLTQATFEFFLADPREICPGGFGPPPRCRGHLTGNFKFYFERGQPAQPFP